MMRPLIRPEMTRVEHRAAAQMHARETMRRTRCKPMRKIAFESPLSHGDAQVGGRHDEVAANLVQQLRGPVWVAHAEFHQG